MTITSAFPIFLCSIRVAIAIYKSISTLGIIGRTVSTGSKVDTPLAAIDTELALHRYLPTEFTFDPSIAIDIFRQRLLLREF